jgi:hypothetical protein
MRVNVNHPSFITFLDHVSNNILSNVNIENYFSLPNEKKMGIQYLVLKLMKNSVKVRAKLTDNDLKSFIPVLLKKNEEYENYEFASVLKDILNNFEKINDLSKTTKKPTKPIKIDNQK